MDNIAAWVRAFRRHLGDKTQTEFALRFGVNQSTVSNWETGSEPEIPSWEAMKTLALERGFKLPYTSSQRTAQLIGFVGAGATVNLFGNGQGPFDEVPMPEGGTDKTVAVEVRGDSMHPIAEDRWLVYYSDRHDPPHDGLYGALCVVGLVDDRVLIKKLLPGRKPGFYDLYSPNAAPLLDQAVTWAAEVEWIKPRH